MKLRRGDYVSANGTTFKTGHRYFVSDRGHNAVELSQDDTRVWFLRSELSNAK